MINYLAPSSGALSCTSRSLEGRRRGQMLHGCSAVIPNSVDVVTVTVPGEAFFAKIAPSVQAPMKCVAGSW